MALEFWLIAILTAAAEFFLLLFFRETSSVRILEKKARQLRKETGNSDIRSKHDTGKTLSMAFADAMIRPLKLLVFSYVVSLLSLYVGVVYGCMYTILTTLSTVFQTVYGFSDGAVGLTYIGLGALQTMQSPSNFS